MSQILAYIYLKRDMVELWIINGVVAAINLTSIQTMSSIALILLTAGYTAWKWRKEYLEKKGK